MNENASRLHLPFMLAAKSFFLLFYFRHCCWWRWLCRWRRQWWRLLRLQKPTEGLGNTLLLFPVAFFFVIPNVARCILFTVQCRNQLQVIVHENTIYHSHWRRISDEIFSTSFLNSFEFWVLFFLGLFPSLFSLLIILCVNSFIFYSFVNSPFFHVAPVFSFVSFDLSTAVFALSHIN